MTLQEIFDQLTSGELCQLSIGGQAAGVIDENNYAKIIPHVNLGLTALYKRFPLKQNRLSLNFVTDKIEYVLHSDFLTVNTRSKETVRYLTSNTSEVFKNDIIKVEDIKTDAGKSIVLNDNLNDYSITTPSATKLRIPLDIVNQILDLPDWLKTTKLEIIYRASHPKIEIGYGLFNPSIVDVQLSETYLEPLILFIASRIHTPLGTGQLEGFASTTFLARYEAACTQIEQLNIKVDQGSQSNRLHEKGFV